MSTIIQKNSSNTRFSRSSTAGPQTPLRAQAASIGSPSILRAEEECIVLELGARILRLGLAGCAAPQAIVDFSLDQQRRAGDLRRWSINNNRSDHFKPNEKSWGEAYEIWRTDLRDIDLGLVGDKLERAVRDAFTRTLLIDSRPRRMLLALPSTLPLPLLSTILETLFSNFQPPSISLMPTSILTAISAGLRSALVVDIGWAETVVTSIFEYREVQCRRSIRASKMLGETVSNRLSYVISKYVNENTSSQIKIKPSFEECEEIVERMIWCRSMKKQEEKPNDLTTVVEDDELKAKTEENDSNATVSLPINSLKPPRIIQIPFSELSEPCESALLATNIPESELDDDELPLHLLVYRSLLKLPVDVRSVCMSRIVFVGGSSQIPGLKTRVMQELSSLIATRGWSLMNGKAFEQHLKNLRLRKEETYHHCAPSKPESSVRSTSQEADPIMDKLLRDTKKSQPISEVGKLRAVNALGAWAGGSLMSQLKIQAVSIIEKEQWSQNGAFRSSRIGESSLTLQRQSMGTNNLRPGTGDRTSWTLGIWGQ